MGKQCTEIARCQAAVAARQRVRCDSEPGTDLFESGIGNDVMQPIALPIVGGMMTSSVAMLILLPVLFVMLKERALRKGTLRPSAVRVVQTKRE
jgi:hypothetical protein